jgi:hypothetical protein
VHGGLVPAPEADVDRGQVVVGFAHVRLLADGLAQLALGQLQGSDAEVGGAECIRDRRGDSRSHRAAVASLLQLAEALFDAHDRLLVRRLHLPAANACNRFAQLDDLAVDLALLGRAGGGFGGRLPLGRGLALDEGVDRLRVAPQRHVGLAQGAMRRREARIGGDRRLELRDGGVELLSLEGLLAGAEGGHRGGRGRRGVLGRSGDGQGDGERDGYRLQAGERSAHRDHRSERRGPRARPTQADLGRLGRIRQCEVDERGLAKDCGREGLRDPEMPVT